MSSSLRLGPRVPKAQIVASLNTPIPDFGGLYITDTAAHNAPFCAFQALTATVINLTNGNIGGTVTTVPVPAGVTIMGRFPTVQLVSGSGIAYYAYEQ